MSNSIDELKNGVNIDATKPSERMDMGSQISTPRHRHISARPATSNRQTMDISAMVSNKEKEPDPNIHKSLADDILNGENSPFAEYKREKIKEMNERMATYEDEQALKEDEEFEEDELDFDDNDSFDNKDYFVEDKEEIDVTVPDTSIINPDFITESPSENNIMIDSDFDNEPMVPVSTTASVEIEEEIENPDIDPDVELMPGVPLIDEEKEESPNVVDEDETLKKLQRMITEKIKPVSKSLNISSFTIAKKPAANIAAINQDTTKVAKWVAPSAESVILMKEFTGAELETLRGFSEDINSLTMVSKKYRMIYDHIVSPKPSTYEAWLKSTAYSDLDHYFFAVFIASYKGANYLPMDCANNKCRETWITDDIPIMDMVKFENDESKQKFSRIYTSEETAHSKGIYCSEIVPLNNKIAIGFKDASAYSLIEMASLDNAFKEKYETVISFIPYIDALYIIDEANQTLIPIGYKIYPDNATKSIKSKIHKFYTVLKSLSTDEFSLIKSYIRNITEKTDGMRYKYISATCPKCNKATEEVIISAEELVFTRYQLGALVNTQLN